MKVEVNGHNVRISGNGKITLLVTCLEEKQGDVFMSSLCYGGVEHGCLPMVDVKGDDVIITNNLDKGRFLYK